MPWILSYFDKLNTNGLILLNCQFNSNLVNPTITSHEC